MRNLIFSLLILFSLSAKALLPSDLQQIQSTNLLVDNPGFEIGKTKWTGSGGTWSLVTSGTNLLFGKQSATFTASASGQYVETAAYAVPAGLQGQSCIARIQYLGGSSALKLQVLDGSSALVSSSPASEIVLAANSSRAQAEVGFKCPSSGSIKLRVVSTASSAIVALDNAYLGGEDRFFRASQANMVGSIVMNGCSGTYTWNTTSTTLASFSATTGCTYVTTGSASAPATQIPAITFSKLDAGEYMLVADGAIHAISNNAYFQFTDGTNLAREISSAATGGGGQVWGPSMVQSINYATPQSNVTLQIKGYAASGGTASLGLTGTPFVIRVYYFPPASGSLYFQTQAPNDASYINDFSAKISAAGVVSDENFDFINGSCSVVSNVYTCTFNSSFFSVTPNCNVTLQISSASGGGEVNIQSSNTSTSQIQWYPAVSGGGGTSTFGAVVTCHRAGSDFKPRTAVLGYIPTSIRSAKIQDQKTSGTAGGASSVGYQTRTLNTIASDPNGIVVSLTSNQFVLNAGTYHINASLPSNGCLGNRGRLWNVTDSSATILGSSGYSGAGSMNAHSFITGTFTITSQKTFRIEHYCNTAQATNGYGIAAGSGDVEVYTDVDLQRYD